MHAILIPSGETFLDGAYHAPSGKARAAIIFCHGFRGSKDGGGRAVRLAEQAAKQGFAAYRFNFSYAALLSQQVQELTAVMRYVRKMQPRTTLLLLGRSLGGVAAAAYAAGDRTIGGLCLWSTPWNLAETFSLALGEDYRRLQEGETVILNDAFGRMVLKPSFLQDFDHFHVREALRHFSPRPLLIVHGTQDELVPFMRAQELFRAYDGAKSFAAVPGGDHRFLRGSEAAQQAVLTWLERF